MTSNVLSAAELGCIDAYWRAANLLSVGQIFLLANPLLREPLAVEHIKPRLIGHWGTSPGLNLIYAHLNRVIRARDRSLLYVTGPGHGGWTWYTGAAAWAWRLGVEGILGVRRVAGGVRIDPCIPTSWRRAEVRVRGPAGSLEIAIEDPDGVGRGVVDCVVDGEPSATPVILVPEDGSVRRVTVELGIEAATSVSERAS